MKMLTIEAAAKITPNTEEFEQAVDQMADLCAAEPKNREAAKVLNFLLMRNSDFVASAAYGR